MSWPGQDTEKDLMELKARPVPPKKMDLGDVIGAIILIAAFIGLTTWWEARSKAKDHCRVVCAPHIVESWNYETCQCNQNIIERVNQ